MSQALARVERPQLTEEQIALVKSTIAKGATNDELALFIQQCNRTGLDPFARQIYSIKRGNERQTQVSIDGARLIAERSGRYRPGHTYYYNADGVEHDVWVFDENPTAARVTVFKDGHEVPGIPVRWKERVQNTQAWRGMPATMLAKCAEMATLRQAFPQELSGLYSVEEIGASAELSYPALPAGDADGIPFEDPAADAPAVVESVARTADSPTEPEANAAASGSSPFQPPVTPLTKSEFALACGANSVTKAQITAAGKDLFPGRSAATLSDLDRGQLFKTLVEVQESLV